MNEGVFRDFLSSVVQKKGAMVALCGVVSRSASSEPAAQRSWLGDEPLWLSEPAPLVPCCGVCGAELAFVAQMYAPIDRPRALHIFGCAAHALDNRAWHVKRTQRPPASSEKTKMEKKKTSDDDWNIDDDDDDGDLENMLQALEVRDQEVPKTRPPKNIATRDKKPISFRRSDVVWFDDDDVDVVGDSDSEDDDVEGDASDRARAEAYLASDEELLASNRRAVSEALSSPALGKKQKYFDATEDYESVSTSVRATLRLAKMLRRRPSQVVRYDYGATPLCSGGGPARDDAPPCDCGAKRSFELEFLPTLVFFLNSSTMDDFQGLCVYSCDRSCDISTTETIFVVP